MNLHSPLDYADYTSKSLDHLGIVATVCKEIGLAEEINRPTLPISRVHGNKARRDIDKRRTKSRRLQ